MSEAVIARGEAEGYSTTEDTERGSHIGYIDLLGYDISYDRGVFL